MVDDIDIESVNIGDIDEDEESSLEEMEEDRPKIAPEFEFILDIPMKVSVEMGRSRILVKELIQLSVGMVLEVDKLVGEPLEIHINDKVVARGEVVVINEKFGIRLTDIISSMESAQ